MFSIIHTHNPFVKIKEMSAEKTENKIKINISSFLNKVLWVIVFSSLAFMGSTFLEMRKDIQQLKLEKAIETNIISSYVQPQTELLLSEYVLLREGVASIHSTNRVMEAQVNNFDSRFNRIDDRLDRILEIISNN